MSQDEFQAVLNELHPDKNYDGWSVGDDARAFRQDAYDLWLLFGNTGARFTEISKLEWSQVDFENRTILLYRPKTDSQTRLVMTDDAYECLLRRSKNVGSTQWVFLNRSKDGPRGYSIGAIKKAIKRAGLGSDVSPHVCRHTVATKLAEAKMAPQEIQHVLGHSCLSTTMSYIHLSTHDAARKAAAALNQKRKPRLARVK